MYRYSRFTVYIQSATNEMNAFNETADRDIEKTITIKYETVGSPASNVTTGAAHVEGTANVQGDWSVQTSIANIKLLIV